MKALLLDQTRRYPHLEPQDACKALAQAVLGPEHFVSDYPRALERVMAEYASAPKITADRLVEPIGERFSRIHIGALDAAGLSPATLAKLFVISSRVAPCDRAELEKGVSFLRALAESGMLPFGERDAREYAAGWAADGYPAVSHTPAFREEYRPAYRVVANGLVKLLRLFESVDRQLAELNESVDRQLAELNRAVDRQPASGGRRVIVAIDGQCGSGKSTLGELLAEVYDAPLFRMDDYFLRPEQRTPERLAEPGGNVDRERFAAEILVPLASGAETVTYRPFDCSAWEIGEARTASVGRVAIVEGSYAMHPELAPHYTVSAMLRIDPALQLERIAARDPQLLDRFVNEWIPLEQRYFAEMNVAERCDFRFAAPTTEWRKA